MIISNSNYSSKKISFSLQSSKIAFSARKETGSIDNPKVEQITSAEFRDLVFDLGHRLASGKLIDIKYEYPQRFVSNNDYDKLISGSKYKVTLEPQEGSQNNFEYWNETQYMRKKGGNDYLEVPDSCIRGITIGKEGEPSSYRLIPESRMEKLRTRHLKESISIAAEKVTHLKELLSELKTYTL